MEFFSVIFAKVYFKTAYRGKTAEFRKTGIELT